MKLMAILVLATVLLFQGTADARIVAGQVVSTDSTANTVTISTPSAAGTMEDAIISVEPETKFLGAASIAELQEGDVVSATVTEQTVEGAWKATSISKPTPVTATGATSAATETASSAGAPY
ncbi:MAG: hypothetical protein HY587_08930 [Candidatus Omnitrophica bacterium]|nr:hypothetical protein [Candidatus Omnitrophota bacterium]